MGDRIYITVQSNTIYIPLITEHNGDVSPENCK